MLAIYQGICRSREISDDLTAAHQPTNHERVSYLHADLEEHKSTVGKKMSQ